MKLKYIAIAGMALLVGNAKASIILEGDESIISIRNSSLVNVSTMNAYIGYWVNGFAPTSSNLSSWYANFKGVTSGALVSGGDKGYYIRGDGPDLSVALPVGLNGVGEGYASLTPVNQQLAVIGLNIAGTAAFTSATQGFALTDVNWKIPTFTTANVATDVNLSFGASTTASVGTFSYGSPSVVTLANFGVVSVPEPSVASLFALGTVGLVALRARRKS
jgi:hypothetical protein